MNTKPQMSQLGRSAGRTVQTEIQFDKHLGPTCALKSEASKSSMLEASSVTLPTLMPETAPGVHGPYPSFFLVQYNIVRFLSSKVQLTLPSPGGSESLGANPDPPPWIGVHSLSLPASLLSCAASQYLRCCSRSLWLKKRIEQPVQTGFPSITFFIAVMNESLK